MFPVLVGENVNALLTGFNLRNEIIEECVFMASRGISGKSECSIDMLYWLVPLLESISRIARSVFCFESLFEHIPPSFLFTLLGFILHIITSYILYKGHCLSVRDQLRRVDRGFMYALNPIIIIASVASPVPSLVHLLIVTSNYSALKGWRTLLYLCFALLVTGHGGFLSAAPGYFFLLRAVVREKQNERMTIDTGHFMRRNLYPALLVLFVVVMIYFIIIVYPSNYSILNEAINQNVTCLTREASRRILHILSFISGELFRSSITYEPTAGVLWYLDAQVFSGLSDYFSLLISTQPFLFSIPLLFRLSQSRPLHTVNLIIAIIFFFRRETSFADIIFLANLFLTHHSDSIMNHSDSDDRESDCSEPSVETQGTRFLPLIFLCITVPMALSPVMMSLWRVTASGNANFPFFQGLVIWVFFALAIIEFANQTVLEIDAL